MKNAEAKDRVIEIDLEAPIAPSMLDGVKQGLRAQKEGSMKRLSAAILLVGFALLAFVLWFDPKASQEDQSGQVAGERDNKESNALGNGGAEENKEEKEDSQDGAPEVENPDSKREDTSDQGEKGIEIVAAFSELGAIPVMVGNRAINPATGEEVWRPKGIEEGTMWLPGPAQRIYVEGNYMGPSPNPEIHKVDVAKKIKGKESYESKVESEPEWNFDREKHQLVEGIWSSEAKRIPLPESIQLAKNDSVESSWNVDGTLFLYLEDGLLVSAREKEDGTWEVKTWPPLDAEALFSTVAYPKGYVSLSSQRQIVRTEGALIRVHSIHAKVNTSDRGEVGVVGVAVNSLTFPSELSKTRYLLLSDIQSLMDDTSSAIGKRGLSPSMKMSATDVEGVLRFSVRRIRDNKEEREECLMFLEGGSKDPSKPSNFSSVALVCGYLRSLSDKAGMYVVSLAAEQPKPDNRSQKANPAKRYVLSRRSGKGNVIWKKSYEANSEGHYFPMANGVLVIHDMGARFFDRRSGNVSWRWTQSKRRSSLAFGYPNIPLVSELDNGKPLIATYAFGGAGPVTYLLADTATNSTQKVTGKGIVAVHSEYHQHNYLLARKGHFVLVSQHPGNWYIEVRKSSDGSLVHRWTPENITPIEGK